ncbi:MAG: hypothetical protein OEY03_16915, partial [Rhizobacter sp.]|nr:hypothetical protein [Rhizobacter sp.]
MRCGKAWLLAGLLAAVPLQAAQAQAPGAPAAAMPAATEHGADVATEWFLLALQITQQTPGFSAPV